MSLLTRAVKAVWNEVVTPETFVKGEEFEAYTRNHLFPKDRYVQLQRTHDYKSNKDDYIENTKEPDFKFRSIKSEKEFYVEVKYRSNFRDGKVEWCKPYQLKRYREINAKTPVYIVIGVGQQPDSPQQVFLIPVNRIKYCTLFRSFLRTYEVKSDRHIDESLLQ